VETMRALQALGYKVTFVPVDNFLWTKAYSAPLQAMGVETIYHPFYSRFEPFITARGAEFDLVIVHRFAAAERVMGAVRTHAPQAKIAFMPADLHFLREHREAELADDALAQDSAAQTKLRELAIIRAADAVLPHSDTEIALLDEEAPETPAFKLPLIYDPEPIAAGFHRREGIGFLGGFGHPPNVDAVDWFLSDVWPEVRAQKPDARFVLAGSKMPDRFKALDGKNGVKVLGFVETVDIFFSEVRASVAPLRYGAGAKGKVAASLALGTPCITTPIGAEGMGLTPGVDVLVSEDAKGFVRHILAMLDDENRWNDVRQAGVEFARRETSREVVRARLSDMLAQLKLS
jgi:glycosyltransferase involved in cell wall biosynthesis